MEGVELVTQDPTLVTHRAFIKHQEQPVLWSPRPINPTVLGCDECGPERLDHGP